MIDIDRAVLQNILLVVPFGSWSPLLETEEGRDHFMDWCADDPCAYRIVHSALADAPVYELDNNDEAFVLSVDYSDAEVLVRELVTEYANENLERLFSAY